MLLKTYKREDYMRARCINCGWILDKDHRLLKKDKKGNYLKTCPNCKKARYSEFPSTQSIHILGGLIYFIDSYNKNIKSKRHFFPPQVYLPIIFACSNYETLLNSLVVEILNQYGSYGRLARIIVHEEILSTYDKKANQNLFKKLTGTSIQQDVQNLFPTYFHTLEKLNEVRNLVVHGKDIDNIEAAAKHTNEAIDFLLTSIEVFRYLHNKFVSKFEKNINYKAILRLGKKDIFSP